MTIDKPLHIKPGELRCPRCMGKDIVPSWPRGIVDAAFRLIQQAPRHCRSCGCRFHARNRSKIETQ